MDETPTYVYIVMWQYSDKSAIGFVKAFDDTDEADKLVTLLKTHGDQGRTYWNEPVICEFI